MKDNITVYVLTHKKISTPALPGYKLLHVGATLHDYTFDAISDTTGDSISQKNENYCELTGLYWVWKNDSKSDIVGFVHYRRHFEDGWMTKRWLSCEKIDSLLEKYDVIVPNPLYLTHGYTVRTQYLSVHHEQDLTVVRGVIADRYPEYLSTFDHFLGEKALYPFNMCIMKKKMFDNYAEWLFKVLFETEKRIDISSYSDYNKRIFGFLSERLFNVWLKKNQLKVIEKPVINTDENRNSQIWAEMKLRVRYQCEKL